MKRPYTLPEYSQQEIDQFYDRIASMMTPKIEFTRAELEQLSNLIFTHICSEPSSYWSHASHGAAFILFATLTYQSTSWTR
jgi:hypothetical protein